MFQGWTFGQKVGAGFATVVLLTLLISVIAVYALRTVVENKDKVIDVNARNLADTRQLEALNGEVSSLSRGYYLAKEDRRLAEIEEVRAQKRALLNRLKANLGSEEQGALAQVESADAELQKAVDATIALKKADKPLEDIVTAFNEEVSVKRRRLSQLLEDLESREAARLEEAKKAASALAADSTNLVVGIAATGLLLAVGLAYFLTTTLTRQIGSAVQHVQSSSGELQAAASQQASGAKEQATAMNEITTTISELMATSRQIAQSSQRVAQIAGQTAEGARSGNLTVQRAQESVSGIRRQVDLIVNHMLDLGRKSQQIGGSSRSSTSWPSRRTSSRSTPRSRRRARGRRGSASGWWPTRSASWPTGWPARRRRSAR
ncbi:MAG: MCP four helix bundle domain-containing protein [Planctomycetota bacterium]|nr:MCP four helix bundle domain-containing protein [Planctomycetota bacterium]